MMNDIDEVKKILTLEQNKIINSSEKYILVSACPGSGKNYTIVKRIEKELKEIKEYQGVIACSFTKEASVELKSRLNGSSNLENCFIGTIDSFVKDIIITFVNRLFNHIKIYENKIKIGNHLTFPEKYVKIDGGYIKDKKGKCVTINDLTKLYDRNDFYKKIGKSYCQEWLKKLKNNNLEISFPMYFLAVKIVDLKIFQDWFNNRFTTLYVDEAQDLNYFQHIFFDYIKNRTNINIVMVGDERQSIYQFRGARPEFFRDLVKFGYSKYNISVSLRCHPSIIYYANKIYDTKLPKNYQCDSHVNMINELNVDSLKKLAGNTFILTETNDTAQELYELFKSDYDVIYTKKIDLNDKEYYDYYEYSDVIDELLKYYLNYNNALDKYKYSYEKIQKILFAYNPRIKQKDFDLRNGITLTEFLNQSSSKLKIDLSMKTILEIVRKLEDKKYKYNYYMLDKKNRIMTIHSSKGLENDNVVIVLNNSCDKVDYEFRNKLFVAITRAKNNVFILSQNNEIVYRFIFNLLSC